MIRREFGSFEHYVECNGRHAGHRRVLPCPLTGKLQRQGERERERGERETGFVLRGLVEVAILKKP